MADYCPLSKRYIRFNSQAAGLLMTEKVVEILFARGLVKVLFATETFAMVSKIPSSVFVPV